MSNPVAQIVTPINEPPTNLLEFPDDKQIIGMIRARDDSQLHDNLIPGNNPFYLAAAKQCGEVNQILAGRVDNNILPRGAIMFGAWEGGGGASAEVNVQKGVLSLRAFEQQVAELPKTLLDGTPMVVSILSRAGFGVTREFRSVEDRESQFRCYAEICQQYKVDCRIDIFDTPHRASWLEEDFQIVYKLRKEGLPIYIGGMTGVSDDETLTEDEFRSRVRSVLEMDAKVRAEIGVRSDDMKGGVAQSAMLIHTLKNTDGRLRGDADGITFKQGNAATYGQIQFEEIDRVWGIHKTGPRQAGFHTHNTGLDRANDSTEAYSNAYLKFNAEHAVFAAVIDLIPGSKDFPGYRKIIDRLNKRGWNLLQPEGLFAATAKLGRLFANATNGFRYNLPYQYTKERAERFHCAPAALSSGIRFGAMPAVDEAMLQLRVQLEAQEGANPEGVAAKLTEQKPKITETMIDAWGCLNEVMQRLLVGYSITPVANYDNTTAGDILMKLVKDRFIQKNFMKDGVNPMAWDRDAWELIALNNMDAVKQLAAANYLTRKDVGYRFNAKVFERLVTIRTSAVLKPEQEQSFFAGIAIADYAGLRQALLQPDALLSKTKSAAVLTHYGIDPESEKGKAYITQYSEWDETGLKKNRPVIVRLAEPKAEELSAGDAKLKRELLFAASVGSMDGRIPEKQMDVLAKTPAHTHINVLWWEKVGIKNEHEQFILDQFRNNLGKSSQFYTVGDLVRQNPQAALAAIDHFILHREKCRNDFCIMAALEDPELLKYKEIQERRAQFLLSAYGIRSIQKPSWPMPPSLFNSVPEGGPFRDWKVPGPGGRARAIGRAMPRPEDTST